MYYDHILEDNKVTRCASTSFCLAYSSAHMVWNLCLSWNRRTQINIFQHFYVFAVNAPFFGSSCRLRSDVSWMKTKRTNYYSNEPSSQLLSCVLNELSCKQLCQAAFLLQPAVSKVAVSKRKFPQFLRYWNHQANFQRSMLQSTFMSSN